jgi:hypothetical protein
MRFAVPASVEGPPQGLALYLTGAGAPCRIPFSFNADAECSYEPIFSKINDAAKPLWAPYVNFSRNYTCSDTASQQRFASVLQSNGFSGKVVLAPKLCLSPGPSSLQLLFLVSEVSGCRELVPLAELASYRREQVDVNAQRCSKRVCDMQITEPPAGSNLTKTANTGILQVSHLSGSGERECLMGA